MKLAWITPFARRSAIGRYSAFVIEAMIGRGHEVTIIAAETKRNIDLHPTPVGANLLHWRDDRPTAMALSDADLCIYQVGNHFEYHSGVVALLDRYPGVCVFHDWYLLDLFLGWADATPDRGARPDRIIDRLYAPEDTTRFHAQPVHQLILSG